MLIVYKIFGLLLCAACVVSNKLCYSAKTGREDWCSWSEYKCCPGYGCCGPEGECCYRLGQEGRAADGCCEPMEQCCSTDKSSTCCPVNARCCKDGRGQMTCCTDTTPLDKILFIIAGCLTFILLLLIFYYYIWDRHDKTAERCKCRKCKHRRQKYREPYTSVSDKESEHNADNDDDSIANDGIKEEYYGTEDETDMTLPTTDTPAHHKLRTTTGISHLENVYNSSTDDMPEKHKRL